MSEMNNSDILIAWMIHCQDMCGRCSKCRFGDKSNGKPNCSEQYFDSIRSGKMSIDEDFKRKEVSEMDDVEDVKAQLREMTNRMKAWRNTCLVAIGMFLVLIAELIFDFV